MNRRTFLGAAAASIFAPRFGKWFTQRPSGLLVPEWWARGTLDAVDVSGYTRGGVLHSISVANIQRSHAFISNEVFPQLPITTQWDELKVALSNRRYFNGAPCEPWGGIVVRAST